MLPIHWATFNLAIHDWYEPVERALREAGRKKVTLVTPKAGESFIYGMELPQTAWWRPLIKKDVEKKDSSVTCNTVFNQENF